MLKSKLFSIVKPTLNTPFHVDFDWWQQNDRNWRVYLRSYLTPEDQQTYGLEEGNELIDLVNPSTAEVYQVDVLQHLLISRYAVRDDFIKQTTSITEAIFRLFLANGNMPMSPLEIANSLGRSPKMVLRMLSGGQVYKGVRPCKKG